MVISQTLRSIIIADLENVYNDLIINQDYCIIKTNSRNDSGIDRQKAILCNMLRASGYGFISTRNLSNFPHESDHYDASNSVLIPHLPADLASKITEYLGNDSYLYNYKIKHNRIREQNIHTYDLDNTSISKELVLAEITAEHVAQVTIKNYHKKIDGTNWQFDYNKADPYMLAALLTKHKDLLEQNDENAIYNGFVESTNSLGMCFFVFSKYIKYMPAISFIKSDDFGTYGIAAALDVYWPLI